MTPIEQPVDAFQLAHWLVIAKSLNVTDRRTEIAPQPSQARLIEISVIALLLVR
jgi:hypothetical protein